MLLTGHGRLRLLERFDRRAAPNLRLRCGVQIRSESAYLARGIASVQAEASGDPFIALIRRAADSRTPTHDAGYRPDARLEQVGFQETLPVGDRDDVAEMSLALVSMIGRPVSEPPPRSSVSLAQRPKSRGMQIGTYRRGRPHLPGGRRSRQREIARYAFGLLSQVAKMISMLAPSYIQCWAIAEPVRRKPFETGDSDAALRVTMVVHAPPFFPVCGVPRRCSSFARWPRIHSAPASGITGLQFCR